MLTRIQKIINWKNRLKINLQQFNSNFLINFLKIDRKTHEKFYEKLVKKMIKKRSKIHFGQLLSIKND